MGRDLLIALATYVGGGDFEFEERAGRVVLVSVVDPELPTLGDLAVVDGEEETAGVVLSVVVVVVDFAVGEVTTTPDGGSVTSPIGAESVGPLG
jgi:hypothetical protein